MANSGRALKLCPKILSFKFACFKFLNTKILPFKIWNLMREIQSKFDS